MKKRFPFHAAVLLLAAFLLGMPGSVSADDNIAAFPPGETAVPASPSTTARSSPPGRTTRRASLPGPVPWRFSPRETRTWRLPSPGPTTPAGPRAGTDNAAAETEDFREPNFGEEPTPPVAIADPIEPVNRAIFVFNDKFYFWVAKPVAKGYNHVLNEDIRVSVRNFFHNLAAPIRVANNLLQGEFRATGTELARFAMNSTMGILGFFDVARDFGIQRKNADLGQTLGRYGLGQGFYIVLPFLGPSSLRDGVGRIGDGFLDPVDYINPWEAALGVSAYRSENDVSLRLGAYEKLKSLSLDPYIALRDAYVQNRAKVVKRIPPAEP